MKKYLRVMFLVILVGAVMGLGGCSKAKGLVPQQKLEDSGECQFPTGCGCDDSFYMKAKGYTIGVDL